MPIAVLIQPQGVVWDGQQFAGPPTATSHRGGGGATRESQVPHPLISTASLWREAPRAGRGRSQRLGGSSRGPSATAKAAGAKAIFIIHCVRGEYRYEPRAVLHVVSTRAEGGGGVPGRSSQRAGLSSVHLRLASRDSTFACSRIGWRRSSPISGATERPLRLA